MLYSRGEEANQWHVIRDLEEANRQLEGRVANLEAEARKRQAQREWLMMKFIPVVATICMAFAALDSIFHWT